MNSITTARLLVAIHFAWLMRMASFVELRIFLVVLIFCDVTLAQYMKIRRKVPGSRYAIGGNFPLFIPDFETQQFCGIWN